MYLTQDELIAGLTKVAPGLMKQDLQVISLKHAESDGKIDSVKFGTKIYRAIGSILVDKLKH